MPIIQLYANMLAMGSCHYYIILGPPSHPNPSQARLCWHVASHVLMAAHAFQGICLKISFLFLTMNISLPEAHCFKCIFVIIYFYSCQSPTYYCPLGGHCSSVVHTAGQRVYNGTWSTMRLAAVSSHIHDLP